jgi:putative endonuclease
MPPAGRGSEPPGREWPNEPSVLGGIEPVEPSLVSAPDRAATSPGTFGIAERRQALGRRGEDLAAEWYRDRGYDVVDRNWRCREGEIDLVVRKARLFVFCEVKARTTDLFGMPVEAVTRTKQARIRRLAARWLQEAAPVRAREIRFDVAAILGGRVDVIEGAF